MSVKSKLRILFEDEEEEEDEDEEGVSMGRSPAMVVLPEEVR